MTEPQQTAYLNKAFAKTQAQAGAAIIKNIDQVKKALQEMEDAEGSAAHEMEIASDSIDFKLNALQQTWVGTFQRMVDRGTIGGILDFLTSLSEGIGTVIDKVGLLNLGGLGLEGLLMSKGLGLTLVVVNKPLIIRTYNNAICLT